MSLPVLSSWRELNEFVAAKKRKREPLRWLARGTAAAEYVPRHPQGFANFRAALRGASDWGQASENLDRIEHALTARHQAKLPLPRKVMQNDDRSLTVFWRGFSVRCFVDKIVCLAGGSAGVISAGVPNHVLDMLAFQAKLEASA